MQRIQTGLVLLRWWEPAHSNDTNIVGLIFSLGCPQRKTTKIYCPIIEGATHSTFQRHPSTPKQLRQQMSGLQQQGVVASRWYKNLAVKCFKEEQETTSENTWSVANYRMFWTLTLNCFSGSGNWCSNSIFRLSDSVCSAFASVV